MKLKKIAVTTDFSAESRTAFAAAAALARRLSAELQVMHLAQVPPVVMAPWPEVGPYFLPEEVFTDVEKELRELVASDPAFQGANAQPVLVRGDSVKDLADHLAKESVELLLAAGHGFTGVKKLLLGSFAEKVLRWAPCPVVILRGDPVKEIAPKRILVPHDFSPPSRAALNAARQWAKEFGAKVRLFFVVEESVGLYEYAAAMQGSFREYLEKVRLQSLERFRRILREEWAGVESEAAAVIGSPLQEIRREATEMKAELVVIGTHSRSGLERLFLGSVAQKVIEHAACPVLAVRG